MFFMQINGFARESKVYGCLLSAFEVIRTKYGLKQLAVPKCFYASKEKGAIVMENLKLQGFKMVNRHNDEGKKAQIYKKSFSTSFFCSFISKAS